MTKLNRKHLKIKLVIIGITSFLVIAGAAAAFAVWRTKDRVQVEFNIHINKELIYLSTYSEPPQFAIWLENPKNGECKQVFVTYRVSRGDWEGKADVPVALPRWKAVFRDGGAKAERSDEEVAVSGATPRDDYFRVRAEVRPGSEWICWIEMNLAGDFNEYYPQFNRMTKAEDEFACGQPALLYRAEIKADAGMEYTPVANLMSLWENGVNTMSPIDGTITTAQNVFDEISIEIIKPKPVLINKNSVEQQDILK
ncbi:MAG: hypothetical protein LBH19_06030 [Dysgonamonadaceae bacterium]|jgi:hypothetical protein|nr:hypothetical protein [Dysgonamonadaceae bacterium]